MGPLPDFNPYGDGAWGVWFNRIHSFEEGEGEGAERSISRNLPALRGAGLRHRVPDRRLLQAGRGRHRAGQRGDCIGCKLCSWACPYGAREFDDDEGVMKKCTLCIDRIYNEHLAPEDRKPACVMVCPVSARHFGDLGDPDSEVSQMVAQRGGGDLMPELGYKPVNKYLPPRSARMAPPATGCGAALPRDRLRPGDRLLRWVDRLLSR